MRWLNRRHPHRSDSYWTCPRGQLFGDEVSCQAEFRQGTWWYDAHALVKLTAGRIQLSYPGENRWKRRWSGYSSRLISGVGPVPGVAAVNKPVEDWAWLAAQVYQRWQQHAARFDANSYDGNSAGLDAFVVYHCEAGAAVVRCVNRFGDAISYLPYGRPPSDKPTKGWSPQQLWSAYGLTKTALARGRGVTVAIIDAFKDTRLDHDIHLYRKRYGLPECRASTGCLRVLNQDGKPKPLPRKSAADAWELFHRFFKGTWATEQSLDVDMVSAACPLCHIVVIQASSASRGDLLHAEDTAGSIRGVTVISNSWGEPEFAGDASYAGHFAHPSVAYVASAGDSGYRPQLPAAVANVFAVGGTQLARNNGGYAESVWDNDNGATGGGCAHTISIPSWQQLTSTALANPCNGMRMGNDLSAIADDLSVYDTADRSLPFPGFGVGWLPPIGGTSASAPFVAGLIALGANGHAPITVADLYKVPDSEFHDITFGTNGDCASPIMCFANRGYDGPTGRGSPRGIGAFVPPGSQ